MAGLLSAQGLAVLRLSLLLGGTDPAAHGCRSSNTPCCPNSVPAFLCRSILEQGWATCWGWTHTTWAGEAS